MDHKQLIEAYTKSLDGAVDAHKKLITESQKDLEKTLTKAREELASLIEADATAEKNPLPESAWVEDHLVLNRQAVDLFQGLFKVTGDLVQELKKMSQR